MSATRLLLLPAEDSAPALCLALDPGGVILARESFMADAAPLAPERDCVLAVPAAHIGLHRLRLRANSPAQAVAAAARLVEDRLAAPHASLHVAVSDAMDDQDRWVAVVDPARMRAWLARAARHGLRPTSMVPDCLLLPAPESGALRLQQAGSSWRARGEAMAFSAEPDLAQLLLDAAPAARVQPAGEDELARGAVAAPALELLQQAFSLRPAAPTGAAAWRTVALLAVLALALLPLGYGAQALRHSLAVRSIDARAATQLQATGALPDGQGAPFARATAALAAARSRDAFAITTGALFEGVARLPGAGVAQLQYGEDGVLAVTLDHDQPGDVERLTAGLAERGVSVSVDTTQAHAGRQRSVLLLGVAP